MSIFKVDDIHTVWDHASAKSCKWGHMLPQGRFSSCQMTNMSQTSFTRLQSLFAAQSRRQVPLTNAVGDHWLPREEHLSTKESWGRVALLTKIFAAGAGPTMLATREASDAHGLFGLGGKGREWHRGLKTTPIGPKPGSKLLLSLSF